VLCRLLSNYQSRIAAEGEYDEGELPGDLVDELEAAAGPAQTAFAVRAPCLPSATTTISHLIITAGL
jgi:hypothetical protein